MSLIQADNLVDVAFRFDKNEEEEIMESIDKRIKRKRAKKNQVYLINRDYAVYLFYYGGRLLFYDRNHHDLYYLEQFYAIERGLTVYEEDCPGEDYDMQSIYDLYPHSEIVKVIWEWYCAHRQFCRAKLVFL